RATRAVRAAATRRRAVRGSRRCRQRTAASRWRRRLSSAPVTQPGPATAEPSRTAESVLEARDLVKRFGDRVALRGVSLSASAGELVAVIGPNGAGKTTLLSILAGIQSPDEGTISEAAFEIGWVPQQPALARKPPVPQ